MGRYKNNVRSRVKWLLFLFLFFFFLSRIFYFKEEFLEKKSDTVIPSVILEYDDVSSVVLSQYSVEERLHELLEQDERISTVLRHQNDYPEDLVTMLSRDIDLLPFVLDFPSKKGETYSETIGNFTNQSFPLLLQWDKRWGYGIYGDTYLAINGCAPTALSMVIAGLTGRDDITPYTIATYAYQQGFYVKGVGTSWSLMTDGASYFGIHGKEIPLTKTAIFLALERGHPVICSVRKGDFTTTGHFIVLVGVVDGKIQVHDPNSLKRSSLLWEYERIESQIRNLWEFSVE